jgi:hypothetical protein
VTVGDVEYVFRRKLGASRDRSGHHIYFYFRDGESEYTVGKLSHSWKGQLNDTQILMLAKKLYLGKQEFEAFVDCGLKTDQMLRVWRQRRAR